MLSLAVTVVPVHSSCRVRLKRSMWALSLGLPRRLCLVGMPAFFRVCSK